MRALVVRQPYAELTAQGVKTIELRSWMTKYRGPLAIVAGLKLHLDRPKYGGPFLDDQELPVGRVVCVVGMVGCEPMKHHHEMRAFYAYRQGLIAWKFHGVVRVDGPEVNGRLGLFEVAL